MDLIYSWRSIKRAPGYAALVVLTLATGIGATTTMFSIAWAVLLRPLPFPEQQRLVTISRSDSASPDARQRITPADFVDWSRDLRSFRALGVLPNWDRAPWPFNVVTSSGVERIQGIYASSGFFDVLGVQPELGRTFGRDDDQVSGSRRVIISHRYWQSRFGGDPDVVGRTLHVDTFRGGAFTIAGVMPARFDFPRGSDVWLSLADWGGGAMPPPDSPDRCCAWYTVFGRLETGVTLDQARAELSTIAARVALRHGQTDDGSRVRIEPLRQTLVHDYTPIMTGLVAAIACILVIGCANVANLMLSRGIGRRREVLIRRALGATRLQLARLLLTESLLLGSIGALAGLLLSLWAQDVAATSLGDRIPFIANTRTDGVVLAFTIGLTVTVSAACGLLPLIDWTRLGWSGRGTTEGPASRRLRHGLVVSQVALAVAVVSIAGLLVKSLTNLRNVDLGFETSRTLLVSTDVTTAPLRERGRAAAFLSDGLERIAALPGVRSVSATTGLPLEIGPASQAITREGDPVRPAAASPSVRYSAVTPGYFAAMGVRLLAGRTFTENDRADGLLVAVVNRTAAERYWPGESPIGKRFAMGSLERFGSFRVVRPGEIEWRTVVGVVSDIRSGGFAAPLEPEVFFGHMQFPIFDPTFVVRTHEDPSGIAAAVRAAIASAHSSAVVTRVRTLDDVAAGALADPTYRAAVGTALSAVALLLGMLGIHGLMSYTVSQHVRDIGVRFALGASRARIARALILRVLALTTTGSIAGLLVAYAAGRRLPSLLFGVTPADLPTLAAACLALTAAALTATVQPLRRAIGVDPAIALRDE